MHGDEVTGSFYASRREFLKLAIAIPIFGRLERGIELRMGVVTDADARDVQRGASMAVLECKRAADLLGARLIIDETPWDVVVAGCSESSLKLTASKAPKAVILNAFLPADSIRIEHPRLFHVFATEKQRHELWNASLERFGAAQLNARYRYAYGEEMTANAWAGWVSIKVLWEAALRARSSAPANIAAFLESPRAQFDGHKGSPLKFDAKTHVLT
jgi:hypothetical protein